LREQSAGVRIARDELRRLRELTVAADALEAEIADLVTQAAPQLLDEPGFGPLTAAKLIGEIAGVQRLATEAKARPCRRHRPDPRELGQDEPPPPRPRRQSPAQHHHPPHRADPGALPPRDPGLHRSQARRDKTGLEATRCLKRHLARRIWHLLQPPRPRP
jgi:hypothetical protein